MNGALSIQFNAIVWRYESKGGWYFVSLPEEDSARIREIFKSQEQGWGRLQVEATFVRRSGRDVRSKSGTSEMPDMHDVLNTFKTGRISEDTSDHLTRTSHDLPLASHIAHRTPHHTSHKSSIWFDTKRNTYLLPIKAEIRNEEGIDEGDEVGVALVGVARSVSDFVYCTYLSDLAVDQAFQHQGIGKELIRRTKLETPDAKLILLSAPKAVDYYPKISMTRHEQCFMLDDVNDLD